jgi:hypothetical protein
MDPNELVDKIMELLQQEFQTVAESVVNPLQNAVASGLVQADVNDPGMLAKVDVIAHDWAENRAAEMVGMIHDDAGVLDANPDAKWAITDTTREALKRIITEAFSDPSVTMEDITQAIDDSGIFSAERAAMIAQTEVATAQMQGTISIWQDSGMVDNYGDTHIHANDAASFESYLKKNPGALSAGIKHAVRNGHLSPSDLARGK